MRLKEELKRLKEREEWQGKLLREKMTIEGIVEGSPVPTFVLDNSHRVILWNRACTDLTGYSSEEMINTDNYYKPFYKEKRPFLADFIIDQNVESFETFYGEGKVRRSESIEGAYEAVKYFKNLSGKERHLHLIATPIFDEKGGIVAAMRPFSMYRKRWSSPKTFRSMPKIFRTSWKRISGSEGGGRALQLSKQHYRKSAG